MKPKIKEIRWNHKLEEQVRKLWGKEKVSDNIAYRNCIKFVIKQLK